MTLKALQAKLRELRHAAGMKLADLAIQAGLHITYLSRAETGQLVLEAHMLQKILRALGCGESETAMLEEVARLRGAVEISTQDQPPGVIALLVTLLQRIDMGSLDEATAKKMHKLLVA